MMIDRIQKIKYFINDFIKGIPEEYLSIVIVFFYTVLIVSYGIFIWKFYKFVSKRDIIKLNLAKYNYSSHPSITKFFAVVLYIIEYIIILPFVISLWFIVLAIILFILSGTTITNILIITAAIVSAIRILAYYEKELALEVAKLLPFIFLSVFILNPDFSSLNRIIDNFIQIPSFLMQIGYFIVFIATLELILRISDLVITRGEE